MKCGPEHPTLRFVLYGEDISCFLVIESVFPNFIRSIMCFRPWFPCIVLLLSPKDTNGPATIYLCMSEGIPGACTVKHSYGESI